MNMHPFQMYYSDTILKELDFGRRGVRFLGIQQTKKRPD
jgi:hypothetical protein